MLLRIAVAALGTSPDWLLSKKVAAVRYISARAPDREKNKGANGEDAELIMTGSKAAVNSCWAHNDETKSWFANDWIGISAALESVSVGTVSSCFPLYLNFLRVYLTQCLFLQLI